MSRARAVRLSSILLCGCAAMLVPACDEAAGAKILFARLDDNGCLTAVAGGGFASAPVGPTSTLGVVDLTAAATAVDLDGVLGLAGGPATRLDHLATGVRFAPGGVLDARDGDAYRADTALRLGSRSWLSDPRGDADLFLAHVLGLRAGSARRPGDVVRLARRFAFPPSQAAVGEPGRPVRDRRGPGGVLSVCGLVGVAGAGIAYSREGSYAVAPLPSGEVLASDGISSTMKLNPAGRVLAHVAHGGELAADEAGNVYVALAANGQLALHAYTAALVPRWSRVHPVRRMSPCTRPPPTPEASALRARTPGGLVVDPALFRLRQRGHAGRGRRHPRGARARRLRNRHDESTGGLDIALYDLDGGLRWSRTFRRRGLGRGHDARPRRQHRARRPLLGSDQLRRPDAEPIFHGEVDVNSYAVALARAGGGHVFTTRIPTTRLTGAAGHGARLVIAGEAWVTPIFPHLWQLDGAGNQVGCEPDTRLLRAVGPAAASRS